MPWDFSKLGAVFVSGVLGGPSWAVFSWIYNFQMLSQATSMNPAKIIHGK